jgi:hypothetical protein
MALVIAEIHIQWIRDKVGRSGSRPLPILSVYNVYFQPIAPSRDVRTSAGLTCEGEVVPVLN